MKDTSSLKLTFLFINDGVSQKIPCNLFIFIINSWLITKISITSLGTNETKPKSNKLENCPAMEVGRLQ